MPLVPLLLALVGLLWTQPAHAQAAAEPGDTSSALPGVVRVPVAGSTFRTGAAVGLRGGYGYTESVAGDRDQHHRLLGSLAGSVRPIPWFAAALRLDGRADMHRQASGNHTNLVGDPTLVLRVGTSLESGLRLGAQSTLWAPGASAPSIAFSAFSPDALLLAAFRRADFPLTLAAQAGFRLDRSAHSISNADRLVRSDRLSLGVSDANALLLGAGVIGHVGEKLELLGEWTWDLRVGGPATAAMVSPMRADAGVRLTANRSGTLQVQLLVEASLSERPTLAPDEPLVVIDPRFAVMAGLNYRPALEQAARPPPVAPPTPVKKPEVKPPPPPVVAPAAVVRGKVTTADGMGIAGAMVHVGPVAGGRERETDDQGGFELSGVAAGSVQVTIRADGYQDVARVVNIKAGQTIDLPVVLERALPSGQIRGYVQSFGGKPVSATVRVEPLGIESKSDEKGTFEVNVPPGGYDVIVQAKGYLEQRRHVRVDAHGVTVVNLDMRAAR